MKVKFLHNSIPMVVSENPEYLQHFDDHHSDDHHSDDFSSDHYSSDDDVDGGDPGNEMSAITFDSLRLFFLIFFINIINVAEPEPSL